MEKKWFVLLITTIGSFIIPFMGSSINIALPSIGNEFQMDAVLLSWVSTSYLLSAAVFLIPFGKVADIHGRKTVFKYGALVYTFLSLLCATSNSPATLIILRFLQGVGAAMIFGTAVAILTSVFPANERGKALGVNVAATYTGLSLGPFFGGFLTQQFGWRSIFLVNVPLGLIIVMLVWRLEGEWAEAKGEKFDLVGSIVYGLGLMVLMYGVSLLPAVESIWLILIGIVSVLAFIKWELHVENSVLNISLFKDNPGFTFSNLAALINYSATFAVSFILSLYLQFIKNITPQTAGLILTSQPLIQAILSPFAGRLSDKVEPQIVASAGMAVTTTGLFIFSFLSEGTPLEFIIATLILLGTGFAFFSSPNTNAVMSSVEKRFYGVASATLGTMRLTGQMLSMGIVTVILALYTGRVQITPEYYANFMVSVKTSFIVFAVLCFIGIFASLARGSIRKDFKTSFS
ncbi:MAG: MFS transporter [Candidatus Bathyarchaeota archaeon]